MSIFNDNISRPLPERIRVEECIKENIMNIVDRVNNHFDQCRVGIYKSSSCWYIEPANTFKTLLNEIREDIVNKNLDLDEDTYIIELCDIREATKPSPDPDKNGFNIKIYVYRKYDENKDILKFDVDLDVFIYKYPRYNYEHIQSKHN